MIKIELSPGAANRLNWNEILDILKDDPKGYYSTKPPYSKISNGKKPRSGSFPRPCPQELCYSELIAATQINSNNFIGSPSLREKFIAEFLKSGLAIATKHRKKVPTDAILNKYIENRRSFNDTVDLTTDEAKEAMRRGAGRVLEMAAREPHRSKTPAGLSSERFDAYLSRLDKLIVTPVPLVDNRLTLEHSVEHIDRVLAEEFSTEVG